VPAVRASARVNGDRPAEGSLPNCRRGCLRCEPAPNDPDSNRLSPGRTRRSGSSQCAGEWGLVIYAAVPHSLDAAWLRDNCQCATCRDPASGQRLICITDLAPDVTVTSALQEADGLHVTFGPDGHEAVFTRTWLAGYATAEVDRRSEDAKRLWSARDFPAGPPVTSWQTYAASDAVRIRCLRELLSTGFMLLRGVPAVPGAVAEVAASFGYIRETNHGRIFDVRVETSPVEAAPASLANTGLPIGPHTDNPYRDPVPTLQALHCLVSSADGDETGLLDGFRAAAQLRAEDPAYFDCLSRTLVTFGYADASTQLRAMRPMIGLNEAGLIREIRYDSRSMEPMRPRSGVLPDEAADEMHEFYVAYRAFAAILLRPSGTLRFTLTPGDCVVFDNTRILRSGTGFTAAGRRHLQGCYADIDGVESTVAVLARSCGRKAG
jgi:gamma-butyrobetaine dioxygenase